MASFDLYWVLDLRQSKIQFYLGQSPHPLDCQVYHSFLREEGKRSPLTLGCSPLTLGCSLQQSENIPFSKFPIGFLTSKWIKNDFYPRNQKTNYFVMTRLNPILFFVRCEPIFLIFFAHSSESLSATGNVILIRFPTK